jgi:hypothetical protein
LDVKTKNAWKGLKQNPGLQKPICFAKEAEEIVSAKLLPSQAAGVLKVQNQESDSLFFYFHSCITVKLQSDTWHLFATYTSPDPAAEN